MTRPPQQLTSVRWASLFPWLLLVRAARVAVMLRVIALAVVGVAATYGGWRLIDSLQPESPALVNLEAAPHELHRLGMPPLPAIGDTFAPIEADTLLGPFVAAWRWYAQPFVVMLQAAGWGAWFSGALAGAWLIAVWGLFGGAIARIAGVYLTYGETLGPLAALRAAARKWLAAVGALLLVAVAVAVVALPLVLVGLLLRFDLMTLLLGIVWLAALVGGAVVAILVGGLAFGWPLMFSTVAVERTDAFDAISRGFAYLYQRPLHLLFYVVVASLLGLPLQVAVTLAADATSAATTWAVSIGAGEGRLDDLGLDGDGVSRNVSAVGEFGSAAILFWTGAIRAAATYFPLAYFWCATPAIYLLLRREIDGTELTDVVFDEGDPKIGLPRLTPDAATGVLQVERTDAAAPSARAEANE